MTVRPATAADLPALCAVYTAARDFMRATGNPHQWGDSKPDMAAVAADIDRGECFVTVDGEGVCGVFAFILGEDPTYRVIDGRWLNDAPYGTIHRIASLGRTPGVFAAAIAFCEGKTDNLRIDTHADNWVMQRLLTRHGFLPCGTIWLTDGSPRLAYQKIVR